MNSSTLWNHPDSFPLWFPPARKAYPLQVEAMGGLPVVLLLCSFHGNAAKQNTQIILFNYGWVVVCLFLCCETLPSCGFCSTVLTAVVQAQESGNAPLLLSHTSEHDELGRAWHLSVCVGHWRGSPVRCPPLPVWSSFLSCVSRDPWTDYKPLAIQWVWQRFEGLLSMNLMCFFEFWCASSGCCFIAMCTNLLSL